MKQTSDQSEKAFLFQQFRLINDYQGKYAEAIEYYEKSLEIDKEFLPSNHPNLATSYNNNIGLVYYDLDNYEMALTYFERALDIFQQSLPAYHPDITSVTNAIKIVKKK